MRIYLAGRYSRRLELCGYRDQLRAKGHVVNAVWLDGEHQISDIGVPIGESGEALVEGLRSGERLRQQDQSDRAATRAEVLNSVESGLPFLQELALKDGPRAVEALRLARQRAEPIWPKE